MNPEEKALLQRTVRLSEENNQILHKMQRAARWGIIWGFIKALIIVIPLVAGYLYIEPYLNQAIDNYKSLQELFQTSMPG